MDLGLNVALKSHLSQLHLSDTECTLIGPSHSLENFLQWRLVFLEAISHNSWPAGGANLQVQNF